MQFKWNPFTGNFDIIDALGTQSNPINPLYLTPVDFIWVTGGKMTFWVNNTLQLALDLVPTSTNQTTGSPMGLLLALTYP